MSAAHIRVGEGLNAKRTKYDGVIHRRLARSGRDKQGAGGKGEIWHGMEPTCEEDRRMLAQEHVAIDIALDIAALLERRGWSHRKLAERMGRPVAYVRDIMGGKSNMTLRTLVELARAFGVEMVIKFRPKMGNG